jgi:hypothetical protein
VTSVCHAVASAKAGGETLIVKRLFPGAAFLQQRKVGSTSPKGDAKILAEGAVSFF